MLLFESILRFNHRYYRISRARAHEKNILILTVAIITVCTVSLGIWPGVTNTTKSSIPNPKPTLKFRKRSDNGDLWTFKILQQADLHFGEDQWTDWGPYQNKIEKVFKSYSTLYKLKTQILSFLLLHACLQHAQVDIHTALCHITRHMPSYRLP